MFFHLRLLTHLLRLPSTEVLRGQTGRKVQPAVVRPCLGEVSKLRSCHAESQGPLRGFFTTGRNRHLSLLCWEVVALELFHQILLETTGLPEEQIVLLLRNASHVVYRDPLEYTVEQWRMQI